MVSSGMLRRVALVRTDVSEEHSACFIWVTRIGEVGKTLAATSNRRTLRRNPYAVPGGYKYVVWPSRLGGPQLRQLYVVTGPSRI
jgi:hypothetical protein